MDTGDYCLIDRDIDWAIKKRLLDRYLHKHGLDLSDARAAQLDLSYHDVNRNRGAYYLLEKAGLVNRVVSDLQIFEAKTTPPLDTRAKLRGDFIRAAQDHRRDYTVDWVHLKLNDQTQRTLMCKDPFAYQDERVDRLIASLA